MTMANKAIFLICLLLSFASTRAQNPAACPAILVTGPAGVTQPGDSMTFMVTVDLPAPKSISYKWTLGGPDGEIVSGQGTPKLTVLTPTKSSFNIVATVEVGGLPAGCPNVASVASPVACMCKAILIDELVRLTRRQEISRIENAVGELRRREPAGKLFFVVYYARAAEKKTRVKWITDQLTRTFKFSLNDFEIVTEDSYDGKSLTSDLHRAPRR